MNFFETLTVLLLKLEQLIVCLPLRLPSISV